MMYYRSTVIRLGLILICLWTYQVLGQNCSQNLKLAEEAYRFGDFLELENLLVDCVENKEKVFNKDQRKKALYLLTLGYLENDKPKEADTSFTELMNLDPEYSFDTEDSVRLEAFKELYLSYRTDPQIYIMPMAGINALGYQVLHYRGTDQGVATGDDYNHKFGFQGGVNASFPLKWLKKDNLNRSNFRLRTGIHFIQSSYEFQDALETLGIGAGSHFELQFEERRQSITIPFSFEYNFGQHTPYNFEKRDFLIFLHGGLNFQFLLNSNITEINRKNTSSAAQNNVLGDITPMRNRFNFGPQFGAGAKLKFKGTYLFIDISTGMWIRNSVNIDQLNYSDELLYIYGYVDNDLRLFYLKSSFGLEIPLYNIRKRKKYN